MMRINNSRQLLLAALVSLLLFACASPGPRPQPASTQATQESVALEERGTAGELAKATEDAAEAESSERIAATDDPVSDAAPVPEAEPEAKPDLETVPGHVDSEPAAAPEEPAVVKPSPPAAVQETGPVPDATNTPAQSETSPAVTKPEREAPPEVKKPAETAQPAAASQSAPDKRPETSGQVMDLDGLESRLRQTKAIGLFTKLELKSQVNDLLDDVEDYHRSRNSMTLSQLEEHFNLLVMKLLVLLEKEDPKLRQDIARARPALWTTLADPAQFSTLKGP